MKKIPLKIFSLALISPPILYSYAKCITKESDQASNSHIQFKNRKQHLADI